MRLVTQINLFLTDGSSGSHATKMILPGEYELERVANPYRGKKPWLVLKGTQVGSEEEDFERIVEESQGKIKIEV